MNDFNEICCRMKEHDMPVPQSQVMVRVPEARTVLYHYMKDCLAQKRSELHWLPEYEEVADWLTDNRGRGLFLYGDYGRGKTVLGYHVLPAILLKYMNKVVNVYDAQKMNSDIDKLLRKHVVSLDDIGTEDTLVSYGNRRLAFAEVMDAAEKYRKLIIVSTNLNGDQIVARYGQRVMERIISVTRRIEFKGQSQRR